MSASGRFESPPRHGGPMRTAREVLNELRWRGPDRLAGAVLWYRDRTRPEGHRLIRGSEIVDLERRYFTTASGRLPYYKIERIEVGSEAVFER
ncbi:MAG TPA: RNA repair domain-containing protein [Thermoplasmata archaeon]